MVALLQGSVEGQPCCEEHYSPASHVLEIKNKRIPLCPLCIKELKESLDIRDDETERK